MSEKSAPLAIAPAALAPPDASIMLALSRQHGSIAATLVNLTAMEALAFILRLLPDLQQRALAETVAAAKEALRAEQLNAEQGGEHSAPIATPGAQA